MDHEFRNRARLIGAVVATLAAAACGSTTTVTRTPAVSPGLNERVVDLRDASGTSVGKVTLSSVPIAQFSAPPAASGSPAASASSNAEASPSASAQAIPTSGTAVKLHVVISSLSPGSHGLHVHAVGSCDPPDFSSAGPHFNPSKVKHGHLSTSGPHAGDLGNITVGDDGKATADMVNDYMTLDSGRENSIVGTPTGTALVIHARPDDESSDPSGNSGARAACGVVSPSTNAVESPSPEATPAATATPTATPGVPVRSATPKPTLKPTATAAPTPTPTHTATSTPTPCAKPTPTPPALPSPVGCVG